MKITALAGGVGAAKFLTGLTQVLSPEDITIIANTGDDIDLFGLRICPDIDTITYTLAGVVNEETGWGVAGDSFEALKCLTRYGEPNWFKIGDRDLATHVFRTQNLRNGSTLTEVTEQICRALHVRTAILPMTDAYCPTRVITDEGEMHFQEYFVRRRCEPRVRGIRFDNIETAAPAPGVERAILESRAVIICPSNPFISIGPILAVPGVREALDETSAKVVAISPIVGGRALKGPAADMLKDLGYEVSAAAVAGIYKQFIDLFILDETDAAIAPELEERGVRAIIADTVMTSLEKKQQLARVVIEAVGEARSARST